jgi:hypothetical protein
MPRPSPPCLAAASGWLPMTARLGQCTAQSRWTGVGRAGGTQRSRSNGSWGIVGCTGVPHHPRLSRAPLLVGHGGREHHLLDRHLATQHRVPGTPDDAYPSPPEGTAEHITIGNGAVRDWSWHLARLPTSEGRNRAATPNPSGPRQDKRQRPRADRNMPFNPLCGARSFAPGKRAASTDTLETGRTRQSGMMHHANTTPSASGNTTTPLEAAAVRLRAHHDDPGRRGGLGHPAAPARTAAPGTQRRAADLADQSSTNVDHRSPPGADQRASPIHHSRPRAGSHQRTDHDRPTGHGPNAGRGRRHDHHHGALDRWRHHPAHRDRVIDHGQTHDNRATDHSRAHDDGVNHDSPAHHHRANQHGSVDDHAGDHDQHRAHHHWAHDDQRSADHDRAGNDHDRTSDPPKQPTSSHSGSNGRCPPARP